MRGMTRIAWLGALAIIAGLSCGKTLTAQGGPAVQPYYLLAAASTNATIVSGCRPTNLYSVDLFSTLPSLSTGVFLKLYNLCRTPASTDTPALVIALPVSLLTSGVRAGHVAFHPAQPVRFSTGLSFRLTTGIAVDNDTGVAASSVIVNLTYN